MAAGGGEELGTGVVRECEKEDVKMKGELGREDGEDAGGRNRATGQRVSAGSEVWVAAGAQMCAADATGIGGGGAGPVRMARGRGQATSELFTVR